MIGRLLCLSVALLGTAAYANPEADRAAFRDFYAQRFPDVELREHMNGVYAIDENARSQWLELEDFPLYEIAVDEGAERFEVPFADGKGYVDCFGSAGVRQNYPYFDQDTATVVTLQMAINDCREAHQEEPWSYDSRDMLTLVSYIAFESRGALIEVATPTTDAELSAYDAGKRFYQSRRGQLNFACSSCHVQLAGSRLRAEILSASLGHVSHWPVYRLKWQEVGSLHKRFQECNSQVGAQGLAVQSEEYRNLEYFLTFMSNGLEYNGPATRK